MGKARGRLALFVIRPHPRRSLKGGVCRALGLFAAILRLGRSQSPAMYGNLGFSWKGRKRTSRPSIDQSSAVFPETIGYPYFASRGSVSNVTNILSRSFIR